MGKGNPEARGRRGRYKQGPAALEHQEQKGASAARLDWGSHTRGERCWVSMGARWTISSEHALWLYLSITWRTVRMLAPPNKRPYVPPSPQRLETQTSSSKTSNLP